MGLLGAVPCEYRRGAAVLHTAAPVQLDFDYLTSGEHGIGVVTQIRAVLLVENIGRIQKGDAFTVKGQRYVVAALDGNDGIEAAAFIRAV